MRFSIETKMKRAYWAYLRVHSVASLSWRARLLLYRLAISGMSGLSGLGSQSIDAIERRTFEIVRAGDQLSFKISRQIPPKSKDI
jgi:hypothetical protein